MSPPSVINSVPVNKSSNIAFVITDVDFFVDALVVDFDTVDDFGNFAAAHVRLWLPSCAK